MPEAIAIVSPVVPRPLRQPLPVVVLCLVVIAVLAVVVRRTNAVTRLDADVVAGIAGDRPPAVVDVARALTNLGDGLVLGLLLVLAGAALTASRVLRPAAAFAPALSLAVGAALAPPMKVIVDRPRPPVALHEVVEHSSGFPSGHSSQAAAGWLALGLVLAYASRTRGEDAPGDVPAGQSAAQRRWILGLAAAVVVIVGCTRLVLSVHSPTDVVAGWLLGLACALVVVRALVDRPPG